MATRFAPYVRTGKDGFHTLDLQIQGMKCASCAFRSQQAAEQVGGSARVDLASGRASVRWQGEADRAEQFAAAIAGLGYEVLPFGEEGGAGGKGQGLLARCLWVAGAASLLVMALGMSLEPPVVLMAVITIAALGYAGQPFFLSAWRAVRGGHANMDVPISVALILTTAMSVFEVAHQGSYAYFDSVVMLLFILLIGRYLDEKTRGRARAAAADLLALFAGRATIAQGEGQREIPIRELQPGMLLIVATGEKIAADGVVSQGRSDVDPSLITGETITQPVDVGTAVFGGMVNLSAPLRVRVTAASGESLVGEVIRLMEKAQQSHARFVRLADRVARLYTPGVFALAALTFVLWWLVGGAEWQQALLVTSTVLIITCPCAMGLAVPAVQVLASSRLFRQGMLLKTGDALEKLANVDQIVFDKTGTLTMGRLKLANRGEMTGEDVKLAASLASHSRHPLALAVQVAHGPGPVYALDVKEHPGQGLEAVWEGQRVRLGSRDWCGVQRESADDRPEMWLAREGEAPQRFVFLDAPKEDARNVVEKLHRQGYGVHLLSGDRPQVVAAVAEMVGIQDARGGLSPTDKNAVIEEMRAQGHCVLMVGDGLNDAAALAAADVSLSPSSALDITQNAADLVFQGQHLAPVLEALRVARRAERLVRENIALSLVYNAIAVPVAMAGWADPLFAAAAMSLSSITVVLNAQRMRR